ncbi:MAG: zinc ribbon domain-containing protein [Desulfobacterales bacterium]|nr:zinc ribbon domain-containing protein [Desulfobacterales bacterium]
MWQYIVIIGLILGAGCWIILPLVRPSQSSGLTGDNIHGRIRQLISNKENTYAVIRELEFDLGMGKLSQEDYESLKKQYMIEAVNCMKEIEMLESGPPGPKELTEQDIENELEQEILRIRQQKPGRKTTGRFCATCGSKVSLKDRFCVNCGVKIDSLVKG